MPAPETCFDWLYAGHEFISDPIRNPQGRAAKRIAKVGEHNMCTSIIVAAELYYGCAKERLETGGFRLRMASVFVLLHHTALACRHWY